VFIAHPALRGYLYGIARNKAAHHRRFFARLTRLTSALFVAPKTTSPGPDDAVSTRL
jgi:DNA-directed RNA polymerase specialized sigma24 family protein